MAGAVGIGVGRWRIGAGDHQVHLRAAGHDEGQHVAHEPIEGHAVGIVAETADEQQRHGLAAGGAEFVA